MKYSASTKPGMGDPYWYEWSVGQQYIIDMLNPDNNIKHVELQANVELGLDDVVITYVDGEKLFVQVKHTRADDTLTFGDLVSIDNSKKEEQIKYSLLGELAKSWNEEKDKYKSTRVCLFTNRKLGVRGASAGANRNIKRPSLKVFLENLKEQINKNQLFSELEFSGYEKAWEEWKKQLSCIKEDSNKLAFLRCLEIETDQVGLEEIEHDLTYRLRDVFKTREDVAKILLGRLDHALRLWTTSTRHKSCITIEDVYEALSLEEDLITYNHDLIPSEPFFESRTQLVETLESELQECNNRVVFLSGVPGTGKTNIISKISGKKNSVIDVRYYAYEPINPTKEYLPIDVSKRVAKETFWNELFTQLRKILRGKLYKYNVPVINSLMTLEDLRNRFFRIASEYAMDKGETFIIAIDGIDHAARAGVNSETFLPTLPNPEYIPQNVKILLAGQPKEDYKNYPSWLFNHSTFVKELDVPKLQENDITSLVNDKFNQKNDIYKQKLAHLISKYAEGNTLAAIFAVQEAIQHPDIVKLESQLQNRQLSGNIQEYYRAIWDSAKKNMGINFVDYKMAGVFAFFNEPINENKLYEIFSKENVSVSDWRNILKALKPLLIENEGNYTILHNDVRVYLSNIIGQDRDHVIEVYSNLADYYLNLQEKNRAYYSDVLRFLKFAGRGQDFIKVYSANYIISAYVNGIELRELKDISEGILRDLIVDGIIDWNQMRCLAFGYLTINQIEKSKYEIEDANFREGITVINVHPYECYVKPEESWNFDIISTVLNHAEKLYDNGEVDRASKLFKQWFSGMNIVQIYNYIKSEDEDDYLSDKLSSIVDTMSKNICFSDDFSIISGIKELFDINDQFAYHLIEKILEAVFKTLSEDTLYIALKSIEVVPFESIITGIKRLLDDNRYEELKQIETILHIRLMKNSMGALISAFLQIISGSACWEEKYKVELWKAIKDVELPDSDIENIMSYYSIYALVASYLQASSRSVIASSITDCYINKHKHLNRAYFIMYFNNVCYVGKWLNSRHNKNQLKENPEDLRSLMNSLFIKNWHPNDRDFETPYLRAYILKAFILLSKGEVGTVRNIVDEMCEQIFTNNPVNQLLDPGILYYKDNKKRVQDWFDNWLGDNGRVWDEALGERNQIIKDFLCVKRRYYTNDVIYMSTAMEKAAWSVIGYASHKEYSGDYLLSWYNSLTKYDDKYIGEYAEEVKIISDKIELLGDNRLEYTLNCKIYADLFSNGFAEIKRVLMNNHYLAQGMEQPSYLVDGLIGFLKKSILGKKELLSIWAIGMGLLDWRNEDNHDTIHSLQQAIELCAEKNEIIDMYSDLIRYGAAYMDLVSDPVKYIIPDRWCDSKKDFEMDDISIEVVERYIDGGEKIGTTSEIQRNIRGLVECEKISEETIERLLHHEFCKDSYSIEHNSLLEYLVEIANSEVVDKAVCDYLRDILQRDSYYLELDLPALVRWKIRNLGSEYCKEGLTGLLEMQKSWITAAEHIQEPEFNDEYDYCALIDWEKAIDLGSLFFQIIKSLIVSEDADAARIALIGLFALIRTDDSYISMIEANWDGFHYRAKEWIMMLYELLWHYNPDSRALLHKVIVQHCQDDEFNVVLYANLLLESLRSDQFKDYLWENKKFFDDIPNYGFKRLIKTTHNTQWINGYDCVMEMKERIEKRLKLDLDDVEKRTADYLSSLPKLPDLVPLHRRTTCKVVCDNINRAFFRVLYKDWTEGRWDCQEKELARIILSASEPYCLLITPQIWENSNGLLIDNVDNFLQCSIEMQKSKINEILNLETNSEEVVMAGAVVDYNHKQEVFGYLLCYLDIPGMIPEYAFCTFERNSRQFLQDREDFVEDKHCNITLHHNGIESFKQSNIMCGFSKTALNAFNWSIVTDDKGIKIIDQNAKQIGRFEYFYGNRGTIGNRYNSNQPHLQRWIVSKEALDKAVKMSHISFKIRKMTDLVVHDFD